MSKLKKFSLLLALAFVFSMFHMPNAYAMDSTTDSAIGIGSMKNIKTATTMESKMSIKLKLKGENLSAEDAKAMSQIEALLSNMVINLDMKIVGNEANTVASGYIKASTTLMGMPLNFDMWIKYDVTTATPQFQMIMKMPQNLPVLSSGKEYLVIDSQDMSAGNSSAVPSLSPTAVTDMTKKMQNLIFTLCDELNAKFNLVSDKGQIVVKTPVGDQPAHSFEIRLDDKTFKDVLNYAFNTLVQNKDFMTMITDLSNSMNLSGSKNAAPTDKEMEEMTKEFNKFLDGIKDIQIIGDKGIVYSYAVNPDGYIVSQNGLFDIVLDLAALNKLSNMNSSMSGNVLPASGSSDPKGKYLVTLEFENVCYNINNVTAIDFPVLTKDNSESIMDLMKSSIQQLPSTDTKTSTDTKNTADTKNSSNANNDSSKKPTVTPDKKTAAKPVVKKPAPAKKIAPVKKAVAKKAPVKKAAPKKTTTKKPVVKKKTSKK